MSAEKQQLDERCAGIEISNYIRARLLEHFVPRSRTRDWFGITINRFRERSTTTPMGATRYATVGRLVPITTVMMEVPGGGWQQL